MDAGGGGGGGATFFGPTAGSIVPGIDTTRTPSVTLEFTKKKGKKPKKCKKPKR